MSLDESTRQRLDELIASNDTVLFMKGNRTGPQCGFSATVIGILDGMVGDYATVDVLTDPAIREGIKEFSQWPTIPQLYVKGEFIGGCDIIKELSASGELATSLGIELPAADFKPTITVTPTGAEALGNAAQNAPEGSTIHLGIDARFESKLYFAPPADGEIVVDCGSITVAFDRLSASRAEGIVIDMVDTPRGPGFRIENPNAPGGSVQQMSVQDLKARLESGKVSEIFDVRTPEERAKASIDGTRLMTTDEADRVTALPKDTELIFHCHHGGRSQSAAEHFANLGFSNVFNVVGGIDAWSQEIDPEVPRY
jgi:monothiol glutaredoxin